MPHPKSDLRRLKAVSASRLRGSWRFAKWCAVIAFFMVGSSGCGGGGGNDGGSDTGVLGVTPASYRFSTQENFGAAGETFTVELRPSPAGTLFISTAVTGEIVDYVNVSMRADNVSALVRVALKAPGELGVGVYEASIEIKACVDSACRRTLGSATVPVHYEVTSSGNPPESGGLETQMIPFPANDVVWDERRQRLYFSVPSAAGPAGNVVLSMDPLSGDFTTQDAGSEPNVLSISDDGQFLYAGIDGASSVQRFKLPGLVPDLKFSLGSDPDGVYGAYQARDLKAAPGMPRRLAVSLARRDGYPLAVGGLALFDDGVIKPMVANSGGASQYDSIQWSSSPATLYATRHAAYPGDSFQPFYSLSVASDGIRQTASYPGLFAGPIHYESTSQRVYGNEGRIANPETGELVGAFDVHTAGAMVPDGVNGSAFFQVDDPAGHGLALQTFDLYSFAEKSLIHLDNMAYRARRAVRWGSTGMAFVTNGPAYLLQGHELNRSLDVSTKNASAAVGFLALPTNDMVWSASQRVLYASVREGSGQYANSVVAIDPAAGVVVSSFSAGSKTGFLAISDDQNFLYVGLDDTAEVLRLKLPQLTPDIRIPLGSAPDRGAYYALDLKVAPGAPGTIAVSLGNANSLPPSVGGLVVFDDAVPRRVRAPGAGSSTGGVYDSIQWGMDATTLYAANNQSSSFDLYVLKVDGNGISQTRKFGQITSYNKRIAFDRGNGLVYVDNGTVVSPLTGQPTGKLFPEGVIAPDSALNRIFYATTASDFSAGPRILIRSFDAQRYRPLAKISVGDLDSENFHTRLVRWGSDGLALSTIGGIYIIRGPFVN